MTNAQQPPLKITTHDGEWTPRYFGVLCGLFCGLYVIASVLNSKLIDINGVIMAGGILVFPLCTILTDIINEVYGFNRTRQAIWTALIVTIAYAVFTQILMILPAPDFWAHQEAYESIFGTSWRFAIAGCVAWLAGEFTNAYIMTRLKILQQGRFMAGRFIGSTIVGQFIDTTVYAVIAFLGSLPFEAFVILCLTSWGSKVLYEVVALPLSIPLTNRIKRLEGVEHFDRQKISLL